MLHRTLTHFMRLSNQIPKYAFSAAQKPPANSTTPPTEPPTEKPKEQRQSKASDDEYHQEDEPLVKQNRNTVGWWIYRFFFWGSFSLLAYNTYLVYNHNKKTRVQYEPGAVPYVIDAAKIIVDQINQMTQFISQPPSKKLLPDPVHPDFHPKTLVLNLSGTLLKTEYIFGKGNKITVRPGLESFLQKLVGKYEIVIFAEEDLAFLQNQLNSVDPRHRFISGFFGKECMVWRGGNHIKDLKYLNRDLKKVVVIDRLKKNVNNQPQNVIILPEFDGSNEDNQLSKLLVLLERLSLPEIPDVRKEITKLGDDPVNAYFERIKQKQKALQKKSGVFGIFNGAPKKGNKQQQNDL